MISQHEKETQIALLMLGASTYNWIRLLIRSRRLPMGQYSVKSLSILSPSFPATSTGSRNSLTICWDFAWSSIQCHFPSLSKYIDPGFVTSTVRLVVFTATYWGFWRGTPGAPTCFHKPTVPRLLFEVSICFGVVKPAKIVFQRWNRYSYPAPRILTPFHCSAAPNSGIGFCRNSFFSVVSGFCEFRGSTNPWPLPTSTGR